jgi:hypothetical protein
MSDQILSEENKVPAENSTVGKSETEPACCPVPGQNWFKGPVAMTICCATPLLLFAAIASFGLSSGAIASGALSVAALLACPVGMFLMMRMMMKNKS